MQASKSHVENILKCHPKLSEKKLIDFRSNSKALFDISTFKCKDIKNCICPRIKKIPKKKNNQKKYQ
jgi:ribosomal protein S17E